MDGFTFVLLLFLIFLILMVSLIYSLKGKRAVYLTGVTATLSAWFIGLILDAAIAFEPRGGLGLFGYSCPYWLWGFAF